MSDIEMRGITKRFSGVIANNGVDFDLCQGEVHALLGENGAGKSTLMNTLYGLYQPDSGTITISGKRQEFTSPHDAITAGIGMVHQHFMLIPSQTVWENMILGLDQLPQVLPKKKIIERIQAISEKYCLQVDPLSSIWQLSIGEQQRVAILQMLFRKTRFLILDEPTAVLTPQEAQHLFEVIRQMTGEGYGIVFISHKLEEVMSLSHRVTVLRKGKKVGTIETSQTSKEQLAEMMIGEKFVFSINKQKRQAGPVILEGDRLFILSDRGLPVVREVTIQIRESEILGIAGISGNGQEELCEALAGLRKVESGDISMGKEDITGHSPRYFIAQGICYIPADRKGTGLIANLTVNENSILKQYWKKPIAQKTWIDWKAVATFALHLIQKFKVMAPSLITPVKNLSGGNQQKLMLGRELSGSPRVVIAVHPTWGLDVAATKFIREQL
ncbi:MAG: ABC transporter ATP-binding protein, partial [Atribacterota bacterium]